MTPEQEPVPDQDLARAVHSALSARDAAMPAPPFARSWKPAVAVYRPWRPALAAFAIAATLAALFWTLRSPHPAGSGLDPVLARELSSDDFWRVPTDELLAHADPAAGIVLPSPDALEISLEESLL